MKQAEELLNPKGSLSASLPAEAINRAHREVQKNKL